jgi:hypothetical protein
MRRLSACQNCLDNVRCEKSHLYDSADIPPVEAGLGCDRSLMGYLALRDTIDPVMGPSHCFEERWNGAWRPLRGVRGQDQANFPATLANRCLSFEDEEIIWGTAIVQ